MCVCVCVFVCVYVCVCVCIICVMCARVCSVCLCVMCVMCVEEIRGAVLIPDAVVNHHQELACIEPGVDPSSLDDGSGLEAFVALANPSVRTAVLFGLPRPAGFALLISL